MTCGTSQIPLPHLRNLLYLFPICFISSNLGHRTSPSVNYQNATQIPFSIIRKPHVISSLNYDATIQYMTFPQLNLSNFPENFFLLLPIPHTAPAPTYNQRIVVITAPFFLLCTQYRHLQSFTFQDPSFLPTKSL